MLFPEEEGVNSGYTNPIATCYGAGGVAGFAGEAGLKPGKMSRKGILGEK